MKLLTSAHIECPFHCVIFGLVWWCALMQKKIISYFWPNNNYHTVWEYSAPDEIWHSSLQYSLMLHWTCAWDVVSEQAKWCRYITEHSVLLTRPFGIHTHTHTHLMALCPGLPGWASSRKVKPIWIKLKQETVSGSGISWATCKSAPRSRQITTPTPHH